MSKETFEPSNAVEIRVCMKKRPRGDKAGKGCCHDNGAEELYRAFRQQIDSLSAHRIILRKSGCLDRCGEGPVICIVNRRGRGKFPLAKALRSLLPANRTYRVRLTANEIPDIVRSFVD